jgi:hypothetical protein
VPKTREGLTWCPALVLIGLVYLLMAPVSAG